MTTMVVAVISENKLSCATNFFGLLIRLRQEIGAIESVEPAARGVLSEGSVHHSAISHFLKRIRDFHILLCSV